MRTIPLAKAVKTERTHEENQERAYIAASRRSDRSLEARVESARRASEIHKRRTGRSLRVTEQDVINEEMYEEEDDDLPHQYRRLTAGLQTGSSDFNRKLAAYLTNHVAMRSALDQAVTTSYAQSFPNAPQFVHNRQSMYQSPFMTQPMAQQALYHPAMFQQVPLYQMPGATSFMQPSPPAPIPLQRPVIDPLHSVTSPPPLEPHHGRAISMTVGPLTPSPSTSTSTSKAHTPQTKLTPQQTSASLNMDYNQQMMIQQQHQLMQSSSAINSGMNSLSLNPPCEDYASPYTMSLPPETQMLLGNTLNPNDPLTPAMMAGSEILPSYYNYDSYSLDTKLQQASPCDGLTVALAPNELDLTPPDDYAAGLNPAPGQNFDIAFRVPAKALPLSRNNSSMLTSDGSVPIVDKEWATFIENDWDQVTV
ncbi:hypothetical protein FGG08_003205 [Glutinoglossum americanum]|uniref:Uncharacterized protein n=1 Tax=Glutinoglossum americanum TaxID=1670608 RepID=A0A9P8HYQ2_9PEZI|nr:hypothetical protein FGG08_003205 [Glutinoglossum americanum]